MDPRYTTDILRRYVEGRVFRPIHPLRILDVGELPAELPAGVILTTTGRLGSNTREIKRGRSHPPDLYAEVLKRRSCEQSIFDPYWVLWMELTDPFRTERLGKVDSKRMTRERVGKLLLDIESRAHTPRSTKRRRLPRR